MITVQVESFYDCIPELAKIFPRHWEELGLFRDCMPLEPQWAEYTARERAGKLLLVTVRRNSAIVAYYTAQVTPGFHYAQTLTATMDLLYVTPEERGRGLARPLFKAVEEELRRRGVQLWYSGFKTANNMQLPWLLEKLGFRDADTYKAKWLGRAV